MFLAVCIVFFDAITIEYGLPIFCAFFLGWFSLILKLNFETDFEYWSKKSSILYKNSYTKIKTIMSGVKLLKSKSSPSGQKKEKKKQERGERSDSPFCFSPHNPKT